MNNPKCSVCGHAVEEFTQTRDEMRQCWWLEAKCHGDAERVYVTDMELMDNRVRGFGEAFQARKLTQ